MKSQVVLYPKKKPAEIGLAYLLYTTHKMLHNMPFKLNEWLLNVPNRLSFKCGLRGAVSVIFLK